ncbi:peptidylprolyl isomerase [Salinisphaera sp.]|uniref:peptidylprolyl isomerase n=1 Tax=Salinisphaera sp. TaxID=1914330 RepID=UPI000C40587B|nr:peptidylprolyl isomerase [Salinisphaera sp.]MBS63359.1 molecular chaperone SurA [Salinisphaera sp.]
MRYLLATGLALAITPLAFLSLPASAQSLGFPDDYSLMSRSSDSADAAPAQPSAQTLDEIVAVVGDGVILESELNEAVARIRARAGGRADQMPPNILRSQVLDQLIMQRLQVQRARERGIEVSDQEIDAGIGRIAQQNNMDMQQFMRAVAADSMTMEQLREQVREELLVSKLRRQEVMSKVSVSDEDVDRYLENQSLRNAQDREYRVRHILLPVSEGADSATIEATRDQLEALREQIVDGDADFADVAASHSKGENALDGGDMGWMQGNYLSRTFRDVVPSLSPGETSEVFRDSQGFHLVQLEDVRGRDAQNQPKVMVQEVQTRHILLKPNEIRDAERTRELGRQIRERLEAGDDFAALAREYSDDTATANQGGDLGWVQPEQQRLDPITRRQLEALSPGEVSPVFQTGEGYEILKVTDRRQRDQTQEAARDRVRRTLGEQKSVEEGELWLRKLRDEAYVDVRMPGYQATGGG